MAVMAQIMTNTATTTKEIVAVMGSTTVRTRIAMLMALTAMMVKVTKVMIMMMTGER